MSDYRIKPSKLNYKLSPSVDQEVSISLQQIDNSIIEYDRNETISLAQVYDNERQACSIFRPTIKIDCVFGNTLVGKTEYLRFRNSLYYVEPERSIFNGIWKGYPQYFEFDFFRPITEFDNFLYEPKDSYKYNWQFYFSYAYSNDYTKELSCVINKINFNWIVQDGIPFVIKNIQNNGLPLISFECPFFHNLLPGESVELSIKYGNTNLFEVQSLGNGLIDSEKYIFNIYNVGYTGNTFANGVIGTFKRVLNPSNLQETKSKYYVRLHKILSNYEDAIITKNGFSKNAFAEEQKLEIECLTPDSKTRVAKKTSSNSYIITSKRDFNFFGLIDNQKRPVTEMYLTIINRGYNGYFNRPFNNSGLKQGWRFNITQTNNNWWQDNNIKSDTNITTSSYVRTSGVTKTFYYNNKLNINNIIYGDICEWNDYEQKETVLSEYFHKLKFNQDVFQTEDTPSSNPMGYYYKPHHKIILRSFSSYIETGNPEDIDLIPNYSYFSKSEQQFRWRDLYTYGFIDDQGIGVNYPYLNNAHYTFTDTIFRIIPEGSNYNVTGFDVSYKPIIDGCE